MIGINGMMIIVSNVFKSLQNTAIVIVTECKHGGLNSCTKIFFVFGFCFIVCEFMFLSVSMCLLMNKNKKKILRKYDLVLLGWQKSPLPMCIQL